VCLLLDAQLEDMIEKTEHDLSNPRRAVAVVLIVSIFLLHGNVALG